MRRPRLSLCANRASAPEPLAQFAVPKFSSRSVLQKAESSETVDFIGYSAVGKVGIAQAK
jgi:hypothetical protein